MKIALRTCESSTGDCTLERDLAGGEYHLVIRVVAVPAGDQFFGGFTNVLTVADAAGEYAGDIQPAGESDVWAEEGKARFATNFQANRAVSLVSVDVMWKVLAVRAKRGLASQCF